MGSVGPMPPDLAAAIATEPLWLRIWVLFLGLVVLGSVLFAVTRRDGRWRLRPEPFAIVASGIAAAVFMDWLYGVVGYVRLLGLGHLIFWTPVYVWIVRRRGGLEASLFRRYIDLYLVVAGISLVIDAIDVVRWMLGDGELLHRWS